MEKISFFSYFNPFSRKFGSCDDDYDKLSGGEKALTVVVTFLAIIASLPIFVFGGYIGGIAAYRKMVNTFKHIDPNDESSSDDKVSKKVHRYAVDDGFLGMSIENRKLLGGPKKVNITDPDITDPDLVKHRIKFQEKLERMKVMKNEVLPEIKKLGEADSQEESEEVSDPNAAGIEFGVQGELRRGSIGADIERSGSFGSSVKDKTLDRLTAEEAREYISEIKKTLMIRGNRNETESPVLKNAHARFMQEAKNAESRVGVLHEDFKKRFEQQKLPETSRRGNTQSSLFQLKTAINMAKSRFPGLTALAYNEEQRIAVARLIQIIMCGEEGVKDCSLPPSSCCFQLGELKGKNSPVVDIPYADPKENISYLDALMATIQEKRDGISDEDHLKDNILHAAELFTDDCLDRTLNTYSCGKDVIKLGMRGKNNPADFVKKMKQSYTQWLRKNPEKVNQIVKKNKQSKFLGKVGELFLSEGCETLVDKSSMNEMILFEVFKQQEERHKGNVDFERNLLRIFEYSRMDPETITTIAEKSNCNKRDIEPLVRIKFLEMMMLMNQSNSAESWGEVERLIRTYADTDETPILSSKASANTFYFSKGKGSEYSHFRHLINVTTFVIKDNSRNALPVAKVETTDKIGWFAKPKAPRSITPMARLYLSWQASEGVMDHLVEQIDSEVVKNQPTSKYLELKRGMEKAKKKLEEIAKIQPNQTLVNWVWNKFGWNLEQDPKLQNLQDLTEIISGISDRCNEFLRVVVQIGNEKEEEVMEVLQAFRESLEGAGEDLYRLQTDYDNKGEEDHAEIVKTLVSEVDRLISQLPKKVENVGITPYLERLGGVIGESNKPKEISWKVKKYEGQILQLRKKFEDKFKRELEKNDMDGSWVLVKKNPIVRELYVILNSVKIDQKDKRRFNQNHLKKVREVYNEKFIPTLRKAKFIPTLRKAVEEDGDNEDVQKICELLFTELSLDEECKDTLKLFDELGAKMLGQNVNELDGEVKGTHEFVQRLNTLYNRLGAVPYSAKAPLLNQWGNSARGQWNRGFDANCQGNPVHVLYRLQVGPKSVKALGMGTPTIEGATSVAKLTPEFIGFIRSYKEQKKKHLFVLNQNAIPKTGVVARIINGDETARCKLILDSQDQKDLKGAVFAIGLAKNSEFYSQKGEFKDMNNADHFKTALYKQVLCCEKGERSSEEYDKVLKKWRKKSGCYVPQQIREEIENFDIKAGNIIGAIYEHVFKKKSELDVHERKHFIELYYDHLTKMMIKELKVDSFNISCKDAIDRGAGSSAQLVANTAIATNDKGVITEKERDKIEELMMVRALLVRKRPPLSERVERFTEGLDFSLAHPDELKALHKAVFGEFQFILNPPLF